MEELLLRNKDRPKIDGCSCNIQNIYKRPLLSPQKLHQVICYVLSIKIHMENFHIVGMFKSLYKTVFIYITGKSKILLPMPTDVDWFGCFKVNLPMGQE